MREVLAALDVEVLGHVAVLLQATADSHVGERARPFLEWALDALSDEQARREGRAYEPGPDLPPLTATEAVAAASALLFAVATLNAAGAARGAADERDHAQVDMALGQIAVALRKTAKELIEQPPATVH